MRLRQSRFGSQILAPDDKGLAEAQLELKENAQAAKDAGENESCRTSQISASRESDYFTDEDSRLRIKDQKKEQNTLSWQSPTPPSGNLINNGSTKNRLSDE